MEAARKRYAGSSAEHLWRRLGAVDFMNQAMLLAATLLLCVFQSILIITALAGRSVVPGLTHRLGLSKQASADVGQLLASSAATSAAVTGQSWVFFVLGGIAGAGALQRLYQRVFGLEPQGTRDGLYALAWLALAVGWVFLTSAAGPGLRAGGPALFWIVTPVAFTGLWWATIWLLLAGRVSWRRLFPCAVATAACWLAMLAVFSAVFSGMVVSSDRRYGPIGVVFALMSFFIAIGVVIILGAAVGLMWQERGLSFRAAIRRLRRGPATDGAGDDL
jgi:membrane protein